MPPGGFIKRMKGGRSGGGGGNKAGGKRKRGTTGLTTEERREKHNALVDFHRAQRQLEELNAISSSEDDDGDESTSSSDADPGAGALTNLRVALGCKPAAAGDGSKYRGAGSENSDSDSEEGEGDDADADAGANSSSDEQNVDEEEGEEGDEAEETVVCQACQADLSGDDVIGGHVCLTCKATFCSECFPVVHNMRSSAFRLHKTLALAELDDDEGGADRRANGRTNGDDNDDDSDDDDDQGSDEDGNDDDDDDSDEGSREGAYIPSSDSDASSDVEAEVTTGSRSGRCKGAAAVPQPKATAKTRHSLLPANEFKTTDASLLRSVGVDASGAWYLRYHADKFGKPDASALASVVSADRSTAATPAWAQALPFGSAAFASTHGLRRLRAALSQTSSLSPSLFSRPTAGVAGSRPPQIHVALWSKWADYRGRRSAPVFTPAEWSYFAMLDAYVDVLDATRTWDTEQSKMEMLLLHLLNHWFKARTVSAAHDAIIANKKKELKRKQNVRQQSQSRSTKVDEEDEDEVEYRDRGFGKTRLLLLLPMRNIALRYCRLLLDILGLLPAEEHHVKKFSVFEGDFSEIEEAIDPKFKRRPLEYRRLFEGNINDTFCFGLDFHRDASSVSFYSHVLNSDIFVASPLGLRRRVEKSPDALVGLSSIEVCAIDQAHVLLMQNWQHVAEVLAMLNKRPKETTEGLSDLRRVYGWAINGRSGRHRQTIVVSEIAHATLTSSVRRTASNGGKVVLTHPSFAGVLGRVTAPIRQHFRRFEAPSLDAVDDARFDFFTTKVFPSTLQPLIDRDVRTILYVPSYFDFVRLRAWLHANHRESYAALCEYTPQREQRRALGQFSSLERPLLVITERFYFFSRYFARLGECIAFYSPPLFEQFYYHLIGKLETSSPSALAVCSYCTYDSHELARVVGTTKASALLSGDRDAYFFVTAASAAAAP